MGVMLQTFYWVCPQAENREHQWWSFIKSKLTAIAQAGFGALCLPPANKAAWWKSMRYDPYDYYDLGEFDQKGGMPTWFGSKAELLDLIESTYAAGLQVYADLVFNHNSGADEEPNLSCLRTPRARGTVPSTHSGRPCCTALVSRHNSVALEEI